SDGARPMLPRSRAGHPTVRSAPPLRGPRSGSRSRILTSFGRRVLPIRVRLAACHLDQWQGLCLTGFHFRRFCCRQDRQMGLHQLQVDLRVSHVLLCWLQMSLRIPQMGLGGGYVLLSGHFSPCRRQSDFRRHGSAGTCHLIPQYAESRGDEEKRLLDRLDPFL
ncbi:MAG: hypothetical protein ACK53Y_09655, partial [bacterium]